MTGKIFLPEELKKDRPVQMFLDELLRVLGSRGELFEVTGDRGQSCRLVLTVENGEPEDFHIFRKGDRLFIQGGGPSGLAYGLQSYTEWLLNNPAEEWPDGRELKGTPDCRIRGVDRFLMNSADEGWWLNASYWEAYIGRLAAARINRLCLATGFDTEYLSPPYPFFFSVDGFERVHTGREKDRDAFLRALRTIGRICHEFHLEFSFAVWQQQPWEAGTDRMVHGLENQSELCDYCRRGMQKLLYECPEIDVIHFRVNHESGVGTEISAEDYWLSQIEAVGRVNRSGRKIKLELRAKGMTDRMVRRAQELGLPVTVSTKYCCEHAGLPHHLTRMRTQELDRLSNLNMARRYSYSDLLKKPRSYELLYRLWQNGSSDLFTWGDPSYVRSFVKSMELGDAAGFEVIPPLTLKGGREFDSHTGWQLFDRKEFQPSGYEDERYWLFYMLYGRIGYDSDCGSFVWKHEMKKRLGGNAERAMDLIECASKIVPLITGFHFPEHPQLWYWTEMSTGAALFAENNYHPDFKREGDTYQDALPCDEGLFCSVSDYVRSMGKTDGKYTPYQVHDWLSRICAHLAELLKTAPEQNDSWEYNGILLDSKMLLELAEFHRHKLMAALGLSHYLYLADGSFMDASVREMKQAALHWRKLSKLGGAYHHNLLFGAGVDCHRRGSWKDYLPEIEKDAAMLQKLAEKSGKQEQKEILRRVSDRKLILSESLPETVKAGQDFQIGVTVKSGGIGTLAVRYRHTNQLEGEFQKAYMLRKGEKFTYTLDKEYMNAEWDLLVYFETVDENGDGMIYPGLNNAAGEMPYRLIRIEP